MKINIEDAEANFLSIVQSLVDKKEDVVYISKDGKMVAQLTLINQGTSKRVGAAKEEMKDFDISLEEFNNIPIDFN
jgi:hypothetical protein